MAKKVIKELTSIEKLCCPWCQNQNILIIIDFSKKNEKNNIGICIKKVKKNMFGLMKVTGCGKNFKIYIPTKIKGLVNFPSL